MPEHPDFTAEIAALKAALVPPNAAPQADHAGPAAEAVPGEVMRLLGDLRRRLAEVAPAAGEEIAAHPLAGVAAAFLLGFVLGRLSRAA